MKFEWDEDKNLANFKKHGLWFEEAQTVWSDLSLQEFFDPEHSYAEDRFICRGQSTGKKLLVVVFCERLNGSLVRIISARQATFNERKQYEERI